LPVGSFDQHVEFFVAERFKWILVRCLPSRPPGLGRVAVDAGCELGERDARGEAGLLDLAVHEHAHETHRLSAGFAEVFALGLAAQLLPAFGFGEGEQAQGAAIDAEVLGGLVPVVPFGAVFGGSEERIVEQGRAGGEVVRLSDHGDFLPVASSVHMNISSARAVVK